MSLQKVLPVKPCAKQGGKARTYPHLLRRTGYISAPDLSRQKDHKAFTFALAILSDCRYVAPALRNAPTSITGEVAEWSNAPHSKCGIPARVSWVQIPPSPPETCTLLLYTYDAGLCGKRRGLLLSAITIDHRATLKALPRHACFSEFNSHFGLLCIGNHGCGFNLSRGIC